MKKLSIILFSILFSLNIFAQKNEHSERNNSLTIGSGLPIVQKTMLQFEHNLGTNWSMGENISYHYGLLGSTQVWSGPKLELLEDIILKINLLNMVKIGLHKLKQVLPHLLIH